jgi:hypothetical protein
MATKRTANGKAARATPVAAAKPDGRKRRAAPRVAVDGDLNPEHCRYDPAKGTVTLGLDVFDGAGWDTVLVRFEVLLPDEVGWLERVVADARAAVEERDGRRPGG